MLRGGVRVQRRVKRALEHAAHADARHRDDIVHERQVAQHTRIEEVADGRLVKLPGTGMVWVRQCQREGKKKNNFVNFFCRQGEKANEAAEAVHQAHR